MPVLGTSWVRDPLSRELRAVLRLSCDFSLESWALSGQPK